MWIERGGWLGVGLIVGAYAAINFGIVEANNAFYLGANILGSILVGVDAYRQRNYQPVVLQVVWILISLLTVLRALEIFQ